MQCENNRVEWMQKTKFESLLEGHIVGAIGTCIAPRYMLRDQENNRYTTKDYLSPFLSPQ